MKIKLNILAGLAVLAGALAFLAAGASAAEKEFQPHRNAPGPQRLSMEKADTTGAVHNPKDLQFLADRQAIVNKVQAYSYLIDEGRWEDWFDIFSEDILFETTVPELGTMSIKGKPKFREMVDERYIKPSKGPNKETVRRHTMANIHVVEQTPTTAKVRTYMLISKVPHADKLKILTTGTYNVELEKRDGKWTITRWYIECDAPLAPSKFPKGPEVTYIPDPRFVIPGAQAGPLPGRIEVSGLPYSMPATGPLYRIDPQPWSWKDSDFVIVDYLTDARAAAKFLPEGVTTFPIPDLPGYSAVKHIWANYRESSVGPYNELIIAIPCLYQGKMWLYVPLIYVTTDRAMASGREIGGWPKKIADIRMERAGNSYRLDFEREGMALTATATVGHKLFSTPLPADRPVLLPYPQSMTLPLPAPTGQEQPTVPLPTLTLKYIPGVGSAKPRPEVVQLIGAPWRLSGDFAGMEGITVYMHPTEEDPIASLPVLKVLGGTFAHGEMTLAFKEVKVLKDFLK
jgi:acetoacetate decarboxylase/3-phenylpropionate/cinnamic acid dioxygenase small subunit